MQYRKCLQIWMHILLSNAKRGRAKYTSINLGTLNNWRSEWDEKKVGPSFIRLKGSNKILYDLLVLDRYMQENEVS